MTNLDYIDTQAARLPRGHKRMCQCVSPGKNKLYSFIQTDLGNLSFSFKFKASIYFTLKPARCNFLLSISVSWLSFNMALSPNH